MSQRHHRAYGYALYFCGAFTLLHSIALSILVTYDGHLYVDLADVLGSRRFPAEWDFLRTPLYPLALKLAFGLFGKGAASVITVGSLFGFIGIWALAAAVKALGYPKAAAAGVVLATLYPTLIAYEHSLLTEAGTFCFLALLIRVLLWSPTGKTLWLKTIALVGVLVSGYYFRPTLLYLAPIVGLLHFLFLLQHESQVRGSWRNLERNQVLRLAVLSAVVIASPFLFALPWSQGLSQSNRSSDVWLFGLIKQAAISPGDPSLGAAAPLYEKAIRSAMVQGELPVDGVPNSAVEGVWGAMPADQRQMGGHLFRRATSEQPFRYLRGVFRTVLLFAGIPPVESENALFTAFVLRARTAAILPGPSRLVDSIRSQFDQRTRMPAIGRFLMVIQPLYEIFIFFGVVVAVLATIVGIIRRDLAMISFSAVPISFLLMHAAILMAIDRYALPAYPILLVGLTFLLIRIFGRTKGNEAVRQTTQAGSESSQSAFVVLGIVLLLLSTWHFAYLWLSPMMPSWDEAHYMSGVLRLAGGIRSGSIACAWHEYTGVLVFKPPLITLPAAVFALFSSNVIFASMVSLIPIFIGLGLAGWSLFRNILPPLFAGVAAVLLCTAPLVTGLMHRFYVENLFLLLSILYLDVLLRLGWNSNRSAIVAGAILGLGTLTKSTFLALQLLPSCYLLFGAARALPRERLRHHLLVLGGRVGLMLIAAIVVAGPWYAHNWRAVLAHNTLALSTEAAAYPTLSSFFANISSGPYLFVFCLAMAGMVSLIRDLYSGSISGCERQTWIALLILGLATFVLTTMAINKATRFSVTSLPTISALASYALLVHLSSRRRALAGVAIVCGTSLIFCFQDSFDVLRLPTVRFGDLKVIDNRHPLNIPDWFDDNHPLDRTNYRQKDVAEIIGADAAAVLGPLRQPSVALTVDGLLLNHDLMQLLSTMRGDAVRYRRWLKPGVGGPEAPDYVIHAKNFGRLYPGRKLEEFYPSFDEDVALGKLDYETIARLPEPAGAELLVFRRKTLHPG